MEIWKDIDGFNGLYQVSNLGNVKSLDRCVLTRGANHESQFIKGRMLKLNGGRKYPQVILCKDGKTYGRLVHRLVATAFIPNPDNLPCINHKDENPKNNHVDNLEWCTYQYNNTYNNRIEKCKDKISKTLTGRHYERHLTDEQRERIRQGAIRGWETRRSQQSRR